MKKLKCLALLFAGVLLFGSCSFLNSKPAGTEGEDMSRNNSFRLSADDEISDAMFASMLEAIKTKDSEAIKGIFSKQALAEDKNIDASIEYLFNLAQAISPRHRVTLKSKVFHRIQERHIRVFLES